MRLATCCSAAWETYGKDDAVYRTEKISPVFFAYIDISVLFFQYHYYKVVSNYLFFSGDQKAGYPPQGAPYPPQGGQPPPQPGYQAQPGYPPAPQPGYPPAPAPHAAHHTTTTTVIATQPRPVIVTGIAFGEIPVSMTCPRCQAQIVTSTVYQDGSFAWLVAAILCFIG